MEYSAYTRDELDKLREKARQTGNVTPQEQKALLKDSYESAAIRHYDAFLKSGGNPKDTYMGKEIPQMFDPLDLAHGSYGVHVDKYLGRSPCDGPPGYIFQKVTYSAGAIVSKTSIAGMYKLCPDHMGYIYHSNSLGIIISTSDVNTSTDKITYNSHGFQDGVALTYTSEGGTAITGLVNGTIYYVVNASDNAFQLSATFGGSAINLTGTGNNAQKLTPTGTGSEVRINQDGADLSGTSDPTPSGISGEAKLVPGDMILGAILQLVDTRSSDNRTGFVTAGLVSNDSASPDSYGPDLASDPSTFITGSSISGGKTHAAMGLTACSVASPNLNIYSPSIVATAVNDLAPAAIGAPINAINVSGVTASTSNQIRFTLNVYALVGARQKTISHYTQPDPDFKMECLTRQFAQHPVSMIH
jgi:hypothetical protein